MTKDAEPPSGAVSTAPTPLEKRRFRLEKANGKHPQWNELYKRFLSSSPSLEIERRERESVWGRRWWELDEFPAEAETWRKIRSFWLHSRGWSVSSSASCWASKRCLLSVLVFGVRIQSAVAGGWSRFWSWGWFDARSFRNWDHRSVPSAPRFWIISWIVRILWNVKLNCLSLSWIVKLFLVVSSLSTICFHFWLVTVRLQTVCGIPSRQGRFSHLIPREKQFSREFIRRACCCLRERRGLVLHFRRFRDDSAFVSSRRSDKEFRQFRLQHPAYASAAEILVRLCRILQNFWVRRDKSELFFDDGAPTAPSIWRRRYSKSTNMDNYENWKPLLFLSFFGIKFRISWRWWASKIPQAGNPRMTFCHCAVILIYPKIQDPLLKVHILHSNLYIHFLPFFIFRKKKKLTFMRSFIDFMDPKNRSSISTASCVCCPQCASTY